MSFTIQGKTYTRSEQNAILGGVIAGFAKLFNIDVTLARAIFILAVVFTGAAALHRLLRNLGHLPKR